MIHSHHITLIKNTFKLYKLNSLDSKKLKILKNCNI